jgi:hypothetical protein
MAKNSFFINDDLAVFDNFFGFARPTFSMIKGEFYNPEDYDLTPKKSYLERLLSLKEEELKTVRQQQAHTHERFEIQKKNLQNDITEIRKKLT